MKPVRVFLILFVPLFIASCSNTRFLQENEQLLIKNKINLKVQKGTSSKRALKQELSSLVKQEPNKGIVRLRLWVYNRATRGKLNRFKNWLQDKVGEAPVVHDAVQATQTARLFESHLNNKGYFYANVGIETKGKKRAKVHYTVTSFQPHRIDSIHWPDTGSHISNTVRLYSKESLLKKGDPYDLTVLRKERARINRLVRNVGYYAFSKDYVFFDADSSRAKDKVDLYVRVETPSKEDRHLPYYINQVFIYPDHDKDNSQVDTFLLDGYRFVGSQIGYKRDVLLNAIFLKDGDRYSQDDYERTLARLIDLGVFKFVNVRFVDTEDPYRMDAHIYLIAAKKNEISVEGELNTNTSRASDYPLGTAINLAYKTKNLFRNADLFSVNLQGAAELQFGQDQLFNTIDITPQLNVNFPKLLPFKTSRTSQSTNPRTRLSLSYNFLRREGSEAYAINLTNFSYLWDFVEVAGRRHLISPLVLSLVNLNEQATSQAFIDRLANEPLLRNRFEEQFIISHGYSFIYNNQNIDARTNYMIFRGNLDWSWPVPLAFNTANVLQGATFSQYLRLDGDIRYNQLFGRDQSLVYHAAAGIGLPMGGTEQLPYVKQFFIGGANSIRAWRIRDLGPGSFNDVSNTAFPDQTADLRLEGNIEYRFGIIGLLKGALFVDAGNMWALEEDTLRPGAKFSSSFINEIAVGVGAGLRMDFTYFIIRFDLAMPVRDPALSENERWITDKINLSSSSWRRDNLLLNLAIGYPF